MWEEWKKFAATAAVELVEPGMTVGLGSGTTMAEVVKALARKKIKAKYVPSSEQIAKLASRLGLKLYELGGELDLTIDGADEIDTSFNMIKGKGGALTREKILAKAAKKVVIVVDRTKLVKKLGKKNPIPVEVIPFSLRFTSEEIKRLGGKPELRLSGEKPFVTDNGNYILDVRFKKITNPKSLEKKLNEIPGVVENGIFTDLADIVIVGHEGGYDVIKSKREFLGFFSKL
ncbi:MAG: ribose-5-phosphate isomerase RpiA [Candidatus Hadarchaeales archaeon]